MCTSYQPNPHDRFDAYAAFEAPTFDYKAEIYKDYVAPISGVATVAGGLPPPRSASSHASVSRRARVWMGVLRSYLVLAVVLFIVKVVQMTFFK
jgi:hypothetical protein